jgi:hypothetical protein
MRKTPLDQFASLPEQPLTIASLHSPPIRVTSLLLQVTQTDLHHRLLGLRYGTELEIGR